MTYVVNDTNTQIADCHLPDIHDIEMQPIEPRYAATNLKLGIAFTLLFAVAFLFVFFQPFFDWPEGLRITLSVITGVLFGISLITTIYNKIADPLKTYALREHDLSFQSGVIFRKKVTQPITRIQHIELKRGPIDRKIGLATLQVFSAGGALHTFEIPGLELSKAQKLRQFILQHRDSVTHG